MKNGIETMLAALALDMMAGLVGMPDWVQDHTSESGRTHHALPDEEVRILLDAAGYPEVDERDVRAEFNGYRGSLPASLYYDSTTDCYVVILGAQHFADDPANAKINVNEATWEAVEPSETYFVAHDKRFGFWIDDGALFTLELFYDRTGHARRLEEKIGVATA